MIRMVLFALGFVAITIGLLVFQPGGKRMPHEAALSQPVTRAEPALDAAGRGGGLAPGLSESTPAIVMAPDTALRPAAPAPARISAGDGAVADDEALRRMTWDALSNLNRATGRETAPGQPGSLLHAIVRRSLDEGLPDPARLADGTGAENSHYEVQAGDTLVSIALAIYGDVNMTGPLFAANQDQLVRPDDLRPGQTLVLPIQ